MAKIRRIVRKLKLNTPQSFDDQYWPVVVALVVLSGFVMGSILAYLRLDDPRWYANALTWLIITALLTAGAAAALAMVENRAFRRSMQLAVVLGLLFHSVLFVASVELKIFERIFEVFLTSNETLPSREPVTVPEYFEASRSSRMRQDFERPVDTDTPQPEPLPEEIQRQETEPEAVPPEPQPTPVPEPEQTVRPNVVRKQEAEETAPRFSEQPSQLSRRMTQARPTPSPRAATATVDPASSATASNLQARDSNLQRQTTQAQMQRQPSEQEPSTTASRPTTSIARRAAENAPNPLSTAAPSFERQIDRAVAIPRTHVELSETPVNARRTDPAEIRPQTTLARQPTTASPNREQRRVEPVPDTSVSVADQRQRRQLSTEARPNIAQTPVSVPNRQTRATTRPDVTTAATEVSPTRNPSPPLRDPTPAHVAATSVRRRRTQSDVQRPVVADDEPSTTRRQTEAIARRQTQQSPQPSAEALAQSDSAPRSAASREIRAPAVSAEVTSATAPSARPAAAEPQAMAGAVVRTQTESAMAPASATAEAANAPAATPSPIARRQAAQSNEARPAPPSLASATARRTSLPRRQPESSTRASGAQPSRAAAGGLAAAEPTAQAVATNRQPSTAARSTAADAAPAPASAQSGPARPAPAAARRRVQPTPSGVVAAAAAPAATPRRPTARPSVTTGTTAEVAGATAVASASDSRGGTPSPASTAAGRQSTSPGATGARSDAEPAIASTAGSGASSASPAASRRPRSDSAPDIAAGPVSAATRRQTAASVPAVTTLAAEVAATSAPTRSDSDQPSPSLASVARQSDLNLTGERSQQSREIQSASTATQVSRFTPQRRTSSDAPSINPGAPVAGSTARTSLRSSLAASPTNVESPAVAQSTRGVASPSAEPARTAMARAITGTAGVGQGRNLDRARPAPDSPALVASASARRAESMQQTPPGPALAPQAPALVRRSVAGEQIPRTAVQAQPMADVATAAGADQPDLLAANASAALSRTDANAVQGPVTAAQGAASVDLGPTQIVSEGETGRASGGGQPAMNFETDAPRLARSDDAGGAPLAAIAATTDADAPTSPPADGGSPAVPQTDVQPTSVARTDAGGAGPVSGGPAKSVEIGPAMEVSMAEQIAEATLSRTELAEAVPGDTVAGGGDEDEDEEERQRRLARAANRQAGPATSVTADTGATATQLASGDVQGGPEALATAVERASMPAVDMARSDVDSDEPGAAEIASTRIPSSQAARAEVPEDVPPGPAAVAAAGPAIGRSATALDAPAATAQAQLADAGADPSAQPQPVASSVAVLDRRAETSGSEANLAASDIAQAQPAAAGESVAARMQRAGAGQGDSPAETEEDAPQLARAGSSGRSITTTDVASVTSASVASAGGRDTAIASVTAAGTSLARSESGSTHATVAGSATVDAAGQGELDVATVAMRSGRTALTDDLPPDTDGAVGAGPRRATHLGAGGPQLSLAGPSPPASAPSTDAAVTVGGPLATAAARADAGGAPATRHRSDRTEPGPASGASGGQLLALAEYNRAEAVEGAEGAPEIGGGTATPTRTATGPMLATSSQAKRVSLAGTDDSGGIPDGSPLAAQGSQAARLPTGRIADPSHGPVGARAGDILVDVVSIGEVGQGHGHRSASPSSEDGPSVSQAVNAGAPLRRSSRAALPTGAVHVAVVAMPDAGPFDAVGQANVDHGGSGTNGELDMQRQATDGGLAVNIDAIEGPGGLGAEYTVDVGLNNRRALRESLQVQVRTSRFVRHNVGGLPDLSTAAVVAAEPFRRRMGRTSNDGSGDGHGTPPPLTEETIEVGLAFLSRQQLPDGSWSLQGINGEASALVTDTGATALALLAFQGAGYNHREHKYADVVRAAVEYLVNNQREDGDLFLPLDDDSNRSVWLYSHALATLALCEAYGMTQDPSLREPAQKAMDFCVASQHPDRGGWRYSPQYGSDTSVTGWMMMALKSGELAGLEVPQESYDLIRKWLDRSQGSSTEKHLYRYNPYAPDTDAQRHGRMPSKTMTSVGLLMRLYLGWTQDTPDMVRGADYLAENPPALGTSRNPQRDTYYWYYATQVMYHMGGDHWQAWNGRLHPLLVESQVRGGAMAGSWNPRDPVPDRWGPHAGRLYVTTMNLLSLEVYYRHLPLYQDTLR